MIEAYVAEFERWLGGDAAERAERRAELAAHLEAAEAAGDLEAALARLGTPREAARAFSAGHRFEAAPLGRRWRAAAIDYTPLFVIGTVVPVIMAVVSHKANLIVFGFPASFSWDTARSTAQNVLFNALVSVGLGWSVFGLARLEARDGQTPGKALLGLRTVSDDGTAVTFHQGVRRRLSLFFGPALLIDAVVAMASPDRRRAFDFVAHTMVIEAAPEPVDAAILGDPTPLAS